MHVRVVHEGLRPFVCNYQDCTSAFAHKHLLVRHRRIHERNKEPNEATISDEAALSEEAAPSEEVPPSRTVIDELTGADYNSYAKETERLLPCPVSSKCAFRFKRLYDQKRHVETAHAEFSLESV